MYIGYMQVQLHRNTRDLSIKQFWYQGDPRTNTPRILREDYTTILSGDAWHLLISPETVLSQDHRYPRMASSVPVVPFNFHTIPKE